MSLLCSVLAGGLLLLSGLLIFLRKRLRESAEAVRNRQAWLFEGSKFWARWLGLEDLQIVVNEIVVDEKARKASEQSDLEQIRVTLGKMREGVLIVDVDNQVVMANEAVRELLSLRESPLGKRLEAVIQGADFFDFVQDVKGGSPSPYFVLEVTLGRETRWFEVTGALLPEQDDDRGTLTLFVLHDITKQTRLERVRTEFVSNLSHELRTPVTIIKGFADTLIEDQDCLSSEERSTFLEKIQKNVGRLNQMLEELLTLSRLENNTGALHFEIGPLHKVILDTTESFRGRLAAGQELELKLEATNDRVMLDSLRIAQVLENYLENALRHAKGFKRLVVMTTSTNEAVTCRVEDDGAGIPEKHLPHLFERFYRADKGRSRESGGTGLGLSIVKHIVQQHGGTVSAESTEGEGTAMIFEIPYPAILAEKAVMSFGLNADASARAIMRARELV